MTNSSKKFIALIETDHCIDEVKKKKTHSHEIFSNTLFICINPFHRYQLKEMGYNSINSCELLKDEDHLIAARQVTQWIDKYERDNQQFHQIPLFNSSLYESIFYLQFLLGHLLMLFVIFKNARKQYPQISSFLFFLSFNFPRSENPYLDNNESMVKVVANIFYKEHTDISQRSKIQSLNSVGFLKRYTLSFLAKVQIKEIKLHSATTLIQPVLVYHHNGLYKWVAERNTPLPWLLKISKADTSWKKIASIALIYFVGKLLPKFFSNWSLKHYGGKYQRVIDLFPCSFLKDTPSQAPSSTLLKNNSFIFTLDSIFYPEFSSVSFDLKEKVQLGILRHCQFIEKCTTPFLEAINRSSLKNSLHFYNIENTGLSGKIGDASQLYDLESTVVSHGTHPYQQDQVLAKEFLRLAKGLIISKHKYTAIQSEISQNFADHFVTESIKINTGPVVFGKMPNNIPPGFFKEKYFGDKEIKLYIHASTYKPRNAFRFLIYENVDEYVNNINKLINEIEYQNNEQHQKIKLVIKIRPTSYLDKSKILKILKPSTHYIVEDTVPFLDLLADCDGIYSFSSTTIEEAFINKKKIFPIKRSNFIFLKEFETIKEEE